MTTTPDTSGLAALAPSLRAAFLTHDYTVPGLEASLGPAGIAALSRSDATALRRTARTAGACGELLGLFVLGDPLPRHRITELIPELDLDAALAAGLLRAADEPGQLCSAVDLRPADTGHGPQWVLSDSDGSMVTTTTRPDHVLGVGQASLSLLRITPPGPIDSLLDLGTGCGIQLLAADARHRVGTDITPRCLDFAAANLALNAVTAELRTGSWFAPVAQNTFTRIVANPPFVIGTPTVGHSYRESGLYLDGATETVVRGAPKHLQPGGVATMLGSWVLTDDHDWRARIAHWLPEQGVSAWVLLRDMSDPEQYVWTWLTDEGADPRTPAYRAAAEQWLDYLAREQVRGIGFGYIYLQAISGPSEIVCEELTHSFDDGLGAEALAHFVRAQWLRTHDAAQIDATTFAVAPHVTMYSVEPLPCTAEYAAAHTATSPAAAAGTEPDEPISTVVERTTGPRWRHELDGPAAAVLRGIAQGALPLAEIASLAAVGFGLPAADAATQVRTLAVDLLRHGIIVPRQLAGSTMEEYL